MYGRSLINFDGESPRETVCARRTPRILKKTPTGKVAGLTKLREAIPRGIEPLF